LFRVVLFVVIQKRRRTPEGADHGSLTIRGKRTIPVKEAQVKNPRADEQCDPASKA
jgi:hypothetical protein